MAYASRSDLGHAFCGYCGYPPIGLWRARAHRVCMRCQMGVILRAPSGAEPRDDAPFLILDRQLTVQAVSRRAEVVLSVDEPAGVGIPLEELLTCDNGQGDHDELALLIELAIAGDEPSMRLDLRPVANPEIRLRGRVTHCGPPPAALLVLTPLAAHSRPRSEIDRGMTGWAGDQAPPQSQDADWRN
jgi:hypothetical protein